jgi:two-component system chemotaxis response regulator CheY
VINKRVLVVDDYDDMREILKVMLEMAGYEVVAVNDGVPALRLLRQESFDLLITDGRMVELSGVDLVRLVRADDRLKSLPILFSSALTEECDQARQQGADLVIHRPLPMFSELLPQIEALVNRRPAV